MDKVQHISFKDNNSQLIFDLIAPKYDQSIEDESVAIKLNKDKLKEQL